MKLRYDQLLFPVSVLGPGRRIGLWVRGCTLACPGCMTPEFWSPGAGNGRPVQEVVGLMRPWIKQADGITISGGEPLQQAEALLALIRGVRAQGLAEVMLYTGYTLAEARSLGPTVQELLGEVDLLIDGRFVAELPTELLWRGSANQVLHLLSPRAQERYGQLAGAQYPSSRSLQLVPLAEGGLFLAGIPARGDMAKWEAGMRARGIRLHGTRQAAHDEEAQGDAGHSPHGTPAVDSDRPAQRR